MDKFMAEALLMVFMAVTAWSISLMHKDTSLFDMGFVWAFFAWHLFFQHVIPEKEREDK